MSNNGTEHAYSIRTLTTSDRGWIAEKMDECWGSTRIISRGKLHYAHTLPGYVVQDAEGTPHGLLTYHIEDGACEIVTLNSFREGIGVGTALVDAVMETARAEHCKRVWLITTNDNLPALRFWQKREFEIVAVYPGAVHEARRNKPEIPLTGVHEIPIRDEIELARQL